MRDYSRISPLFWSGETGRRLRGHPDAQVLAFYLMTCPSSTMSGLLYLPLPTIAHETGLDYTKTNAALGMLEREGFAYYDYDLEVVWLPEMARCQVGAELVENDNRIKGLMREVERFRRSIFFLAFFDRYRAPFHLPTPPEPQTTRKERLGKPSQAAATAIGGASEGPSAPLARTFEGPSKALRSALDLAPAPLRSQDQDQDQDQAQEHKDIVAPASLARPAHERGNEAHAVEVPLPLRLEVAAYADPGLLGSNGVPSDFEATHAAIARIQHAHTKGYLLQSLTSIPDAPTSLADACLPG